MLTYISKTELSTLLLLLLNEDVSARLRESDLGHISSKIWRTDMANISPQYKSIDRNKRKWKLVEDYIVGIIQSVQWFWFIVLSIIYYWSAKLVFLIQVNTICGWQDSVNFVCGRKCSGIYIDSYHEFENFNNFLSDIHNYNTRNNNYFLASKYNMKKSEMSINFKY